MAFTKITQQELNSRGATTLPNQPTIPAQQLKQEFDAPAKEIVAPAVNNLIDELEATSAAASIGAVAPTGRSGSTVKEVLDDISEDLSTVEGSSHSHSNKSLLDSYDQTNANLSDAVTKKHEHSNKSVLDNFSESGGKPLYNGQTIGEGDMKKSDYDSDSTVKNAGGIKAYVDARVSAAYIPAGTKTVAELLPALLIAENNNKVYNITDSGLTTEYFLEGAGKPIYPGDNVGIAYVSPNTYKFDLLAGIVDLTPYAKTADLGTAAYKDSTNAVTQASTDLVESGAVYASVNAVAQDLSDANLAITALQTASTNLGKYKAEADSIAPVELDATGASQAYAVDDQFYLIDVLLTATSPIAQNDAIVVYPTAGYNCKPSDSVTEQLKNLKENRIYGFHIASGESDPDKMVTYLADAVDATPAYMDYAADEFNYGSWGDAFFMPRPVMLKSDGTVDYYLNPDDYSKKVDGTASDIANTSYDGNAMMEWGRDGRKIWYKVVPDKGNTGASVFIANYQADEGYVDYPFHNADGVSMPHFYTPIYNGSVVDSKMRSLSGQQVSNRLTATQEREKAQANNPTGQSMWDIECFADRTLINFLLILMSRSVDTQTKFGQGAHTGGSEAVNNTFRTGQHNAKGLFYGTNSGQVASNDFANIVKIFGMENWYGFQWRRLCGMILSDGAMKYKMTIGKEDGSNVIGYNTDGANYKVAGSTALSGTNGTYLITEWFTNDGMFPCGALDGQSTQYYCDACWYNNSGARFAYVGGASNCGAGVGAFCVVLADGAGGSGWHVGAGLSCKPLA